LEFKDHFFSANQVTFTENLKDTNGYDLNPRGIDGL
jgi:hypothetical protein